MNLMSPEEIMVSHVESSIHVSKISHHFDAILIGWPSLDPLALCVPIDILVVHPGVDSFQLLAFLLLLSFVPFLIILPYNLDGYFSKFSDYILAGFEIASIVYCVFFFAILLFLPLDVLNCASLLYWHCCLYPEIHGEICTFELSLDWNFFTEAFSFLKHLLFEIGLIVVSDVFVVIHAYAYEMGTDLPNEAN